MNNIPKNCDECHDKAWCDNLYRGLGCKYEEDVVKQPSHYKHGRFETIDEMLIVFGPQKTYDYCIIAAWKYRARAAYKGNFEQDMKKADEYLEIAKKIAETNMNYVGPLTLIKEEPKVISNEKNF